MIAAGAARALLPVPEPADRSGCLSCVTARCCVHFDPELTGFDLTRVAIAHGLAPSAVARLRPAHGVQAGADGVRLGRGPETWLVCLRSRAASPATAELDASGRPCLQLEDVAPGVRRCRIYAARPMRCRTFPTELGPEGVAVETPEAICPPGAWAPGRTDLPTTRLLHLRAIIERSVHRAWLTRWNAHATARKEADRSVMEARFWERVVADHRALSPLLAPLLADHAVLERHGAVWARAERDEAPLADSAHGPPLDTLDGDATTDLVALLADLRAAIDKM